MSVVWTYVRVTGAGWLSPSGFAVIACSAPLPSTCLCHVSAPCSRASWSAGLWAKRVSPMLGYSRHRARRQGLGTPRCGAVPGLYAAGHPEHHPQLCRPHAAKRPLEDRVALAGRRVHLGISPLLWFPHLCEKAWIRGGQWDEAAPVG